MRYLRFLGHRRVVAALGVFTYSAIAVLALAYAFGGAALFISGALSVIGYVERSMDASAHVLLGGGFGVIGALLSAQMEAPLRESWQDLRR